MRDGIALPYEVRVGGHRLHHHNFGCPSTSEILGMGKNKKRETYAGWPLHAKEVWLIDMEVMDGFALGVDRTLREEWEQRKPWLDNSDGRYAPVAKHCSDHWDDEWPRPIADINKVQFDKFNSVGFVRKVDPHNVKARCRIFLNPEYATSGVRLRGITHTYDFNSTFESVGYLRLMTLSDTIYSVHDGDIACTLDQSSFFSQFGMSDDVQMHLCFKFEGEWHCWTRLPMGTRPACHIAQTTLDIIAFESRKSSIVRSYIDNTKFAGGTSPSERDKLHTSIKEFIMRSFAAKSKINGIPYTPSGDLPPNAELDAWISSSISANVEFLGVSLNHTHKTVALSLKSVAKATKIRDACLNSKYTARQFSAALSMLMYTHQVLGYHIAGFGVALQFWRNIHVEMQAEERWDHVIEIPMECRKQLHRWANTAVRNVPRLVPKEKQGPSAYLITDASATGWSGILVIPSSGEIRHASGHWPMLVKSSSKAEPVAVLMAMTALVPDCYTGTVRLCSDNSGTVHSFIKGFATSKTLNDVVAAVQVYAPQVTMEAMHVAGIINPADDESRGRSMDPKKLFTFIAQTLGVVGVNWKTPTKEYGIEPFPHPGTTSQISAVHVIGQEHMVA